MKTRISRRTLRLTNARPLAAALIALAALTALACTPAEDRSAGGPDTLPPDASLGELLEHPDAFERARRVAAYLELADPEELPEIRFIFEMAPLNQGAYEYALFGHWWAQFDPQAAFTYTDQSLRMESGPVLHQVVRTWAHSDPQGLVDSGRMMDHSLSLQSPTLRTGLVDALVVGWFESGQPGVEEWVMAQEEPNTRAQAMKTYARMRVLKQGDEETLQWIVDADHLEDEDRRLLMASALNLIAHQNPKLTLEWVDRAKEADVDVRNFLTRIANAWGHHEPQEAAEWLLTYPDDRERKRALRAIGEHWVRRDPEGLAQWLMTRDVDPAFDYMISSWVRTYAEKNDYLIDWPTALDQVLRIASRPIMQRQVFWSLNRWGVSDKEAALAWLDDHPGILGEKIRETIGLIPDEERERIEAALAAREKQAAGSS